jgi:uncharacterized protein (UPF0218 family)
LVGQYRLPEEMRSELAKPLGRLFKLSEIDGPSFAQAVKGASFVVTVGDRVTETIGKTGRVPDVQIVDSRENRKPRAPPKVRFSVSSEVKNPAGSITSAAVERIGASFEGVKPARVLVEGEEDLLAIPAILLAPDSASVFYGQPGMGIVLVRTDRASRARSRTVMMRMGFPDSLIPPNR